MDAKNIGWTPTTAHSHHAGGETVSYLTRPYELSPVTVERLEKERRMDKTHVFKGQDSQWYWSRRSENGATVAEGGEGYTRREDATEAAERENPGAEIVVETEEEE